MDFETAFLALGALLPLVMIWMYHRGKVAGLKEAKRKIDKGLECVGLVTGILDEYKS